jgi:hypothetical protein
MIAATGNQVEASVISVAITLLVLAWLLYRQRQVRVFRSTLGLAVVLVIGGIAVLSGGGPNGLGSTGRDVILGVLLLGDAAGLGALRAWTVQLWRSGGTVFRQGSWLTMGLWVVGIGIHALVGALAGISDSTLLLYLGVTLAAQQLVLQARAGDPYRLPERATPIPDQGDPTRPTAWGR